jgi:hypothetical protein
MRAPPKNLAQDLRAKDPRAGPTGRYQAFPVEAGLDDRTAAYIRKAQVSFELLRNAAARLAGLMVLASIGSRERVLDEPLLAQAEDAFREAEDMLRGVAVPDAAAHHHFHLSTASRQIGEALRAARQGALRLDSGSLDRTHRLLRGGWQDMLSASKALPGFQVVDFGQSCCAAHLRLGQQAPAA